MPIQLQNISGLHGSSGLRREAETVKSFGFSRYGWRRGPKGPGPIWRKRESAKRFVFNRWTQSEIRNAVRALNCRRHFQHTTTIGGAWHATRGCDPTIQKHHAQALIELGALDAAEALLGEAISSTGLIGHTVSGRIA